MGEKQEMGNSQLGQGERRAEVQEEAVEDENAGLAQGALLAQAVDRLRLPEGKTPRYPDVARGTPSPRAITPPDVVSALQAARTANKLAEGTRTAFVEST